MKKLVFLVAVLLFVSAGSVFAQRGGGGGQGPRPGGAGGQRPDGVSQRTGNPNSQPGQRPDGASQRNGQNGQNGQHPEGAGNGQPDKRFLSGIHLTREQKVEIKQIRKDAKANETDPKTVHSQIVAVLTPEQLEKIQRRREHDQDQPKP